MLSKQLSDEEGDDDDDDDDGDDDNDDDDGGDDGDDVFVDTADAEAHVINTLEAGVIVGAKGEKLEYFINAYRNSISSTHRRNAGLRVNLYRSPAILANVSAQNTKNPVEY